MKIIGITGSSGSGKTSVAKLLEEKYKVKTIDADKVVKEMSVPGTEYIKKIEECFGKEILLQDGKLNKKLLAEKIYQNKEDLEKLNNITFKYVVDEIKERVVNAKENYDFIVIDAPLLIESGLDKLCDYIIAVIANENIKIKRICARDNLREEIAKMRLQIQKDDEFYIKKANYVISNNENINLEGKIKDIVTEILN